jgi:hypothetical protein
MRPEVNALANVKESLRTRIFLLRVDRCNQ